MKKRKKFAALFLAAVMLCTSAEGVLAEEQTTEIGTEAVTEAVSESQTEISAETSTESGTEASTEAGSVSEEEKTAETPASVEEIKEEGIVTAETLTRLPETEMQELPEDMSVVASDGVDHAGVDYLTVSEVQELSEEGADHYTELCETAKDNAKEAQEGVSSVFTTNDAGEPELTTSVDIQTFFASAASKVKKARKEDLYDQLSGSAVRKAFKASLSKAKQGKNSFTVAGIQTVSVIASAINAAINANVAWYDWINMGKGKLKIKTKFSNWKYKTTASITKSKFYSASLETKAKNKVSSLVKKAKSYAKANFPDDQKYGCVKYFDDWLCKNNYYNYDGTDREANGSTKMFFYCHSSYGCLLKGYGVCESYARAMARLLDAAGINNYQIVGTVSGGHAWNYVEMQDGNWYMVDTTNNDSGDTSSGQYLCAGETSGWTAHGVYFPSGSGVTYPTLASAKYTPVVKVPEPTPESEPKTEKAA